jgi:hypothetical protein
VGLGFVERRLAPAWPEPADPAARLFARMGAAAAWVADWGWLRANLAWEARDEGGLRAWLATVRAAQPGQTYFRVNTARILAHDLPAWRREAEPAAPAVLVERWRAEAAEEALAWLEPERHDDPALWIEAGHLAWHALRDRDRAITCYGRAAALPGAPWIAGRIHTRLLLDAGRAREARDFLRRWVPRLPADDPTAQRELMVERLAALERELEAEGF